MGLSALSHRLVGSELARGTVNIVRLAGWPLKRAIRIVQLQDAFAPKVVQHFLELARKRIPQLRFA